ncbi:MAG: right-handed parallel beta-helix repeat-containing protein [Bacteroidetes bacterium]|nr:right-handed parallel beta-helix repeat-containing protein [Bacteroidota bacterium]
MKTSAFRIFLVCILICISELCFSGNSNFTWTGNTSTSWNVTTNWSPNGVPSTNDSVTIVTGSNTVLLANDVTVKRFTMTSGTLNLNGKTLSVSTLATFTAGTINNGHLTSSGATTITFGGTTFGAVVNITASTIYLNGSVFNDTLSINKSGNSNDNSKGGNTFNKYVSITNSARGALVMADSFPDIFDKILKVSNTNEGTVYLAHRAQNNRFNDNVLFYGKNIYSNYYGTAAYYGNIILNCPAGGVFFGYSTGSASIADTKKIGLGDSSFASGSLYLRNFIKLGTEPILEISLSGTAKLYLEQGTVFNSSVSFSAPSVYLEGSRFNAIATITNTGSATVTSTGGSYFADSASIKNNSSSSNTFTLGSSSPDTFAISAYLYNIKGTFNVNNAVFSGKAYLKNAETATSDDRFMIASTGNVLFKGNISIENSGSGICFGKTGGTSTLQTGKTLSFVSGLTGNVTLKYFTEQGTTAHSFTLPSATTKLTLGPGTSFGGNLSFYGQQISLNGTTFNGNATISRYGNIPDTCLGGNVYNGITTIQDSSSSTYGCLLSYSATDDYNGDVTFIHKGSGAMLKPCYNKNSTFAGNITINANVAIQFGTNGGTMVLDGANNQSFNNSTSNPITVKKLQINKSANSATLSCPVTVSDSLIMTKGWINTDTTNVLMLSNGSKLVGGSDSSYVNGPLKKTGNSAFVFPLGSASLSHPYHPLEITAPSSSTDAYTAIYYPNGQTMGSISDTSVDNLSECQFWSLNRVNGTAKVKVKLSWNHDSCEVLSPVNMRIVAWNDSMWKDAGNSAYSGDSISGNATSVDSATTKIYFTLAIKKCLAIRNSITQINIHCQGSSDGSAIAIVTHGTPGYSYLWSDNKGASISAINLHSGLYMINISDKKGCIIEDSITISEPDSIIISAAVTPSACADSTGVIDISSLGGTGSHHYIWSGIIDTTYSNRLENIPAGKYIITVIDSNGCSASQNVYVPDSDGPGINIISQANPICFGVDSGSVEIEGADGKDPFIYKWADSELDSLPIRTMLRSGIYPVEVINNSGCISYDTIEIAAPDSFYVSLAVTGTPCGSSSGEIVAVPHGGQSPLYYLWSSSADTDSIISSLPAGIDTLFLSDVNGCQIMSVGEVLSTSGFSAAGEVLSNAKCVPDSGGVAHITVTGGTSPYTYSWVPTVSDSATAVNMLPGEYVVTIRDQNGCSIKDSIIISGPEILKSYIQIFPPSASSLTDGFAYGYVEGGVAPYTYQWSNGSTLDSTANLGIGTDSLIVTDKNGCQSKSIAKIIQPTQPCKECDYWGGPTTYCGPFSNVNCSPCTTVVQKNIVTDFGADGTDNISDECEFEEAVDYFKQLPDATPKVLVIPSGTFIIGRQGTTAGWYQAGHSVLCFDGIKNMTISGKITGSSLPKLQFENCMKYGVFDYPSNPNNRLLTDPNVVHVTGSVTSGSTTLTVSSGSTSSLGYSISGPAIPQGTTITNISGSIITLSQPATYTPSTSQDYAIYCGVYGVDYQKWASPGIMINFTHSNNIKIENLELDGNLDNAIIGGGTDDGIQIIYDGIFINATNNVTINNVNVHHFGRDGLVVYYDYCPSNTTNMIKIPPLMNCNINNSLFTYNGRNGMTWGGGKGLTANNCEFSWSGQGRLASQPSAGIDIELEQGTIGIYDGLFTNCRFLYNKYYGVTCNAQNLTDPSKSWDLFAQRFEFRTCTFVGAEIGYCVWPNSRGFKFSNNCNFYGEVAKAFNSVLTHPNLLNTDNVRFSDCYFHEDYTDPVLGTYSFSLTGDNIALLYDPMNPGQFGPCNVDPCNNTCPGHHFLIDFSLATRVYFTNCDIRTHYMSKTIDIGASAIANSYSLNIMQNTRFISTGLNGMYCDGGLKQPLSSFNFTDFRPGCQLWSPIGLTNYGADWWCYCNATDDDRYQDAVNPTCINVTNVYPRLTNTVDPNIYSKFTDPAYPNAVTTLRWSPCQSVSAPTCSIPRKARPVEMQKQSEVLIYPNPSHTIIIIENCQAGDELVLQNSLGTILKVIKVESSKYELNIEELNPGPYFILVNRNVFFKFIKI